MKARARRSDAGAWIVLAALIVFVVLVRARISSVPLERDEGEYGYAGQLILHGVPPYKLAYNMKFPGTYYAYALILALFGESARGIHLGLLLVNAASIVLVFVLGRRLLDARSALVSASVFAALSLDRFIMGPFAHATHFVILCALGGFLLLLRANERASTGSFVAGGVLLGLAVLMKQHAVFFLPLAALLAAGDGVLARPLRARGALRGVLWTALGVLAPFVAIALLFTWQGVIGRAWFWTFSYAKEYVTQIPLRQAAPQLLAGWKSVTEVTLPLWALAGVGLPALLLGDWTRRTKSFVLGLLVTSFLALCPGFYFRQHYFILLLPALALLAGAAFGSGIRLLERAVSRSSAQALACLIVVGIVGSYVVRERAFLFSMTPRELSRVRYGSNPFVEAPEIARYIRERTVPEDRIAVLGSEPEIYFYADRTSATGYIYTYPLMEHQAYSARMQAEMIREIEAVHPKYLVFAQIGASWLLRPDSDTSILDWGNRYTRQCYTPVGIADIYSKDDTRMLWDEAARGYRPVTDHVLYTFRRRSDEPCSATEARP